MLVGCSSKYEEIRRPINRRAVVR